MGCRCSKSKGFQVTTTTTTAGPNVTTTGGVRFAHDAGGVVTSYATELEARAARVRHGSGTVYRL